MKVLSRHLHLAAAIRSIETRFTATKLKCKFSTSTPTERPSQVSKMVGIFFFSSICCGAIGLGVWQTKRYAWKIGVIEESQRKLNDIADVLPDLTQSDLVLYVNKMHGRRVAVTGKFDHSKEILLGPRSAPPGLIGAVAQGLAVNPQVSLTTFSNMFPNQKYRSLSCTERNTKFIFSLQGYFIITPLTRNDGYENFVHIYDISLSKNCRHEELNGTLYHSIFFQTQLI